MGACGGGGGGGDDLDGISVGGGDDGDGAMSWTTAAGPMAGAMADAYAGGVAAEGRGLARRRGRCRERDFPRLRARPREWSSSRWGSQRVVVWRWPWR